LRKTSGGTRPQRGILWGLWDIVGDCGDCGDCGGEGNRKGYRLLFILPL